jgi:hypothetical protein
MIQLMLAVVLLQDSVPGTYSLEACREACTSADAVEIVAKGFIVLAANQSGCFDIERQDDYPSYLAVHRQGYTSWSQPTADSVVFWTYHGPDASHLVRAALMDSGFVGRGHSSGAGIAYIQTSDEFILGRRIGPPDLNRCSIYREDRRAQWAGPLVMIVAAVGLGFALAASH